MSVWQIPQVNVKTSGRHISLSACREPARVQASVVKSQVIESIAKEHDTTSHSHSASSQQGLTCFPFHCTVALARPRLHSRNRRELSVGPRIQATPHPRSKHVHAPSERRYKVNHRSIHNARYYLRWLLGHGEKLRDNRRALRLEIRSRKHGHGCIKPLSGFIFLCGCI